MITRVWHGRTKKKDAEKYRHYVVETGIPEYQKTDGNLDIQIWQNDEKEETDIWTVTRWKDYNSVKSFAGDDFEKAKYYPEDKKFLLELEPNVKHYNTFLFSNYQIKNYIKQIEELYKGENWLDENFLKKFKMLDEEKAFIQPASGKHSAAEILWHCIYWRRVVLKRMQGDFEFGERTEKEQNFLPLENLKEKGWKYLLSEFENIQTLLTNFLKTKDDNFLEEICKPGYNIRYLIEGIISHDAYHLGQIGFVITINSAKF
ncbi:MAG: DinB family protein [Ignavibacteria bacterium]